jgi:hypothetical protein
MMVFWRLAISAAAPPSFRLFFTLRAHYQPAYVIEQLQTMNHAIYLRK